MTTTDDPRLRRVLAHIDSHLHERLDLKRLSRIAAVSPFHLQRRFRARFGLTAAEYVRRRRLKRAAYQLAFRRRTILEIALDNGFASPEAFARAFRRCSAQSPTEFRRRPGRSLWPMFNAPLPSSEELLMQTPPVVDIVDVDPIPVVVLEHRGDPLLLGDSIRRFIAWRRAQRLPPSAHATYNILYHDPDTTDPAVYRFDLCVAAGPDRADPAAGIVAKTIPGGRRAYLRHVGSDAELGSLLRYLLEEWLPASGEALGGFPPYVQRLQLFPDVAEHQQEIAIYLPLR